MATMSGETEGAGGVGEGGHSAEDLAALSMRDLLARRASHDAISCDAVIIEKGRKFFEALNRWLPTANPVFAGVENVLTVENWEPHGRDAITYRCRLGTDKGYLVAALLSVLGTLGLVGMMPDVIDGRQISLIFPVDSLDSSDMGILVERARAACEAECLAGEDRERRSGIGGKLPELKVPDIVAEVRVAAVVAEVGEVEDPALDLGPDQDE